jgi:hypothetical protein
MLAQDSGLRFTVLTPEKTLLAVDSVVKVRLRLIDGGWLSIYPKHAPLIAETLAGPVEYFVNLTEVRLHEASARNVDTARAGVIELPSGILYILRDEVFVFTSGLTQEVSALSVSEDEGAVRFDRLARELLIALKAHPEGVLAADAGPPQRTFRVPQSDEV